MKLREVYSDDFPYNYFIVCEKPLSRLRFKELDIFQFKEMSTDSLILDRADRNKLISDGLLSISRAELREHFSSPVSKKVFKERSLNLPVTRLSVTRLLNPLNWRSSNPTSYTEVVKYDLSGTYQDEVMSLQLYLYILINDHFEVYQEFQESITYTCRTLHEICKNEYLQDKFIDKVYQAERLTKEYYKFAIDVRRTTDLKSKELVSQSISNHDEIMNKLIDGMEKINSSRRPLS